MTKPHSTAPTRFSPARVLAAIGCLLVVLGALVLGSFLPDTPVDLGTPVDLTQAGAPATISDPSTRSTSGLSDGHSMSTVLPVGHWTPAGPGPRPGPEAVVTGGTVTVLLLALGTGTRRRTAGWSAPISGPRRDRGPPVSATS